MTTEIRNTAYSRDFLKRLPTISEIVSFKKPINLIISENLTQEKEL